MYFSYLQGRDQAQYFQDDNNVLYDTVSWYQSLGSNNLQDKVLVSLVHHKDTKNHLCRYISWNRFE